MTQSLENSNRSPNSTVVYFCFLCVQIHCSKCWVPLEICGYAGALLSVFYDLNVSEIDITNSYFLLQINDTTYNLVSFSLHHMLIYGISDKL